MTFEEINGKINAALERLAEAQAQTKKELAILAEVQARSDARLESFIATVERFISERHNEKRS